MSWEDMKRYLFRKRLEKKAGENRILNVRITGQTAVHQVTVKGTDIDYDVIEKMVTLGIIESDSYQFENWPDSDITIGPDAVHGYYSVPACELGDEILLLTKVGLDDAHMVCLYGCPKARNMSRGELQKTIEVIRYE